MLSTIYSTALVTIHANIVIATHKIIILNIIDMSPHTRTKHTAASEAKYALEMNLGWFSAKNIKAGKKIAGLEKAPNAE